MLHGVVCSVESSTSACIQSIEGNAFSETPLNRAATGLGKQFGLAGLVSSLVWQG